MSRIVDTIRRSGDGSGAGDLTPSDPRRVGKPDLGVVAYFHFEDRATVERVVEELRRLPVRRLRTAVSWADWHRDGGPEWSRWLMDELLAQFDVLPCVLYTPPHLGLLPKISSPPKNPSDYGDFVHDFLASYDGSFTHVELWNEPNNYIEWDWTVDPEWVIFAEMIAHAAEGASSLGVRTVLGGMSPLDPNWINLMYERGAMTDIDVIGIHGFPGTWEAVWDGWDVHVDRVLEVSRRHDHDPEVWITECGYSTWNHDVFRQAAELVNVARAPVRRAYWYSAEDLDPVRPTLDGFHADERAYHFGLHRRDGSQKLAARLWADGGIEAVEHVVDLGDRVNRGIPRSRRSVITGGAGFVGTNLADRLATDGKPVMILDNLGRPGVETNLRWLKAKHGDLVTVEIADLRDRFAIRRALEGADEVFHLAAQVAVTTSLVDPLTDFAVNLEGTLNLLEEVRAADTPPAVLFTSTNKVYGGLEDLAMIEGAARYEPADPDVAEQGISEARPLEFCSPYGCSKGGAEQYVLDYAKTYGIQTVVFRMSCIYGPHQFGTEDQGWVAHFLIKTLEDRGIVLYGDGKQVRDLLYVDDLVEAVIVGIRDDNLSGEAFNIGGGPANSVSLLEVVSMIEEVHGSRPAVSFDEWRPADQRYYVTDYTKFEDATGWSPKTSVADGMRRLYEWLRRERTGPGSGIVSLGP